MKFEDRIIAPLPRDQIMGLSGLEVLQRMIVGTLPAPPFSLATKITLVEAAEGSVVFEGDPTQEFLNPLGSVHGGWMATILDSAMGCAIHSRIAAGQGYTTLEMKVNFVRAVTPQMRLVRCVGRVLHFGRSIATSEGTLVDVDSGALLAHGSETCLIMPARL